MGSPESLYYQMHLIREAENAIIREYPLNQIKTPCHLAIGAEAIAVAICDTFSEAHVFGTYRNHHWYLARGGSLQNFFKELYGKENDIADGKAGSMHLNCPREGLILTSAVVATQLGPAIGYAFAQSYKKTKRLTICSLGDGATEEGAFFEAMNIASLYQLPILFVLEDNDLAIHQLKENRQAYHMYDLMRSAFRMEYIRTEGTTLDNVISVAKAVKTNNRYPAMLHLTYHRFMEHVGTGEDYSAGYREKPKNIDRLDPLKTLDTQYCVKQLSLLERKKIRDKVSQEIEDAILTAKSAPFPTKEKLYEHVFAS